MAYGYNAPSRNPLRRTRDEKAKYWNFITTFLTLISCYNLNAFLLNLKQYPEIDLNWVDIGTPC